MKNSIKPNLQDSFWITFLILKFILHDLRIFTENLRCGYIRFSFKIQNDLGSLINKQVLEFLKIPPCAREFQKSSLRTNFQVSFCILFSGHFE